MRFTVKSLFVLIAVLAVGVAVVLHIQQTLSVRTGENVDQVEWLPVSASNVSYFISDQFTAYQFRITEDKFKDWCPEPSNEITQPVTISTWKAGLNGNSIPKSAKAVIVTNGLFCELNTKGYSSIVVFDRDTSFGYHQIRRKKKK